MKEQELRNKVIAMAQEWLKEGDKAKTHWEVLNVYNSIAPLPRGYKMQYTDEWCAAFVSAVGAAVGLSDIILPECSCNEMIKLYKAANRWIERDDYIPRAGDIIMYAWEDNGIGDWIGPANHTGIITTVREGIMVVVEGNKSNRVGARTVRINGRYIRGFCIPDYKSKETEAPKMDQKEFYSMFEQAMSEYLNRESKKPASSWAAPSVERLEQVSITDGTRPLSPCTREEVMVMLDRLIENYLEVDHGGKEH